MTDVLKPGYVRLGLHADVLMEDARVFGLMGPDSDPTAALELFGRQDAGVVEVSVSYSILQAPRTKGKGGDKVAVHIVSQRKEGEE